MVGTVRFPDFAFPNRPFVRAQDMVDAGPGKIVEPKSVPFAGRCVSITEPGDVKAALQVAPILTQQTTGRRCVEISTDDQRADLLTSRFDGGSNVDRFQQPFGFCRASEPASVPSPLINVLRFSSFKPNRTVI